MFISCVSSYNLELRRGAASWSPSLLRFVGLPSRQSPLCCVHKSRGGRGKYGGSFREKWSVMCEKQLFSHYCSPFMFVRYWDNCRVTTAKEKIGSWLLGKNKKAITTWNVWLKFHIYKVLYCLSWYRKVFVSCLFAVLWNCRVPKITNYKFHK